MLCSHRFLKIRKNQNARLMEPYHLHSLRNVEKPMFRHSKKEEDDAIFAMTRTSTKTKNRKQFVACAKNQHANLITTGMFASNASKNVEIPIISKFLLFAKSKYK